MSEATVLELQPQSLLWQPNLLLAEVIAVYAIDDTTAPGSGPTNILSYVGIGNSSHPSDTINHGNTSSRKSDESSISHSPRPKQNNTRRLRPCLS